MQAFADSILQIIETYAQWAWLIVFLIAFIESMAILGLFVPGWVLLVGVGTLIGSDVLEFLPIVISAYFGAVVGEYLSYLAGYHYHEKILSWKFIARHQPLIARSKDFFEKHGVAGVFFGRFIGPVRAVLPLIAGISEMPKRTFFWVNLTSGLIWAPLYLIPGILIGAAYQLDAEQSNGLLLILVLIAVVAWFATRKTKELLEVIRNEKAQKKSLALLNSLLAWILLAMLVIILANSDYSNLLVAIFKVLYLSYPHEY